MKIGLVFTLTMTDVLVCMPPFRVAVKVSTYTPSWERDGVKLKVDVTGLAVTGSAGEKVKLVVGRPTAVRVTVLPGSGHDALIPNVRFCPGLML